MKQPHNPKKFKELTEKATMGFVNHFKSKKLELAPFDYMADNEGLPASEYSTARALGAVYTQLAGHTGTAHSGDYAKNLADMFKKAGIKRVLEVGPGSRGIVHILDESGIAKDAGLEMSAIDLHMDDKDIRDLKRRGIEGKKGDAKDLDTAFGGKKFDMVVGVGVLTPGGGGDKRDSPEDGGARGLEAQAKKSHHIVKSVMGSLSDNPHSFFCSSAVMGGLALDKGAVSELAHVVHWNPISDRRLKMENNRFNVIRPEPHEFNKASEYHSAYDLWYDLLRSRNGPPRFFTQAADLVVLKRKQ